MTYPGIWPRQIGGHKLPVDAHAELVAQQIAVDAGAEERGERHVDEGGGEDGGQGAARDAARGVLDDIYENLKFF